MLGNVLLVSSHVIINGDSPMVFTAEGRDRVQRVAGASRTPCELRAAGRRRIVFVGSLVEAVTVPRHPVWGEEFR